jgi:SPP1 family predicted phage head-tail adaptor
MRLGNMRERVRLEGEARVPNGQGGYTRGWVKVADLNAAIEGQSGQEAMTASVERSVTRWRVTIRDAKATPKQRMIWGEIVLDIVSAMPDPKNRGFQLLLCESGAVAA